MKLLVIQHMNRGLLKLLVMVILLSCNQIETEHYGSNEHQIDSKSLTAKLDSIQKNGQINGFAVAMVNQDGIIYEKGFGVSSRETEELYTRNTIQHIASISKTLIGISLMKAQEMGKLKLDDPINDYLPFEVNNPYFPSEGITIRHLATHTSGINDTDEYMNRAWIITKGQDLDKINTDYPAQKLNPPESDIPMAIYLAGYLKDTGPYYHEENYIKFKPGERYNYSNIGATLCALVIEQAVGVPFDLFTKEHILSPLKMNSSGWSLEDVNIEKHSRLYRNDNSVLPFYTAITYPDGMLISSSSDMAKYLLELIKGYNGEGILLEKESYKELFRAQLTEHNFESRNANNPYNGDYNPGIFIGHSALGYVGHSGGDAGVGTWMYFNKEAGTGRYIVINTDMGNDERAKELQYYAIWDTMNEYFE